MKLPLESHSDAHQEESHQSKLISHPENSNQLQPCLENMMKRYPPSIMHLFSRILPYLNGKYHVDEIIYRENLTRKELKMIVGHCSDEIITSLYPDSMYA